MLRTARQSLDYFEQHFGPYPYPVIRFVEISAFTRGFAGTAYPATLFINESFGYTRKIGDDPAKDILNEMVSHELSHTWWGNAGIAPDYREGNLLMTETLAMYAELMAYRKAYGTRNLADRVLVHKDIYLSNRGFAAERPLYKLDPAKSYLAYDKGMVVMYQLCQYMEEEKINQALRRFYNRFTYPAKPVATDLLQELYAVADASEAAKIRELFEQVVTYELRLGKAAAISDRKGGYNLSISGAIEKLLEDGNGKSVSLPFTEDLDIGITFKDGTQQRLSLKPEGNKVSAVLAYKKEPVSVTLDPEGKLLNRSEDDKARKVTLR